MASNPNTRTILDAYPVARDCDISVVTNNRAEAKSDMEKAVQAACEAFDRFQWALENNSPDVDELRRKAEQAQDFADAATLDFDQANFTWTNFWN